MLITGPILMLFPRMTLQLYGLTAASCCQAAVDTVPWFGSLVLLMGWVECRVAGRLTRPEVEAWLIADIAYFLALKAFVDNNLGGQWNFWSFGASALFPLLWCPVRLYWLLYLGHYDDVQARSAVASDKSVLHKST